MAAEEHVVLQFGKVGKDEFTMDYRWPMSPLQAPTLSLTCFLTLTLTLKTFTNLVTLRNAV